MRLEHKLEHTERMCGEVLGAVLQEERCVSGRTYNPTAGVFHSSTPSRQTRACGRAPRKRGTRAAAAHRGPTPPAPRPQGRARGGCTGRPAHPTRTLSRRLGPLTAQGCMETPPGAPQRTTGRSAQGRQGAWGPRRRAVLLCSTCSLSHVQTKTLCDYGSMRHARRWPAMNGTTCSFAGSVSSRPCDAGCT